MGAFLLWAHRGDLNLRRSEHWANTKKEEAAWDLLMPLAQPDRAVELLLESVVVKNPLAVFFGQ